MHHSHLLRKGRISLPFHYYVITTVTSQRKPLFTDLNCAQQVILELYKLEQEGSIKNICYTLMPDHLHWQFQLLDQLNLGETVKYLKGRSAQALKKTCAIKGKIWQKGYFDHQIKHEKDLIQQARYIIANPLRAKLVDNVTDYPFWHCIYLK
jgi:REP element-mobilizing transposase RayT